MKKSGRGSQQLSTVPKGLCTSMPSDNEEVLYLQAGKVESKLCKSPSSANTQNQLWFEQLYPTSGVLYAVSNQDIIRDPKGRCRVRVFQAPSLSGPKTCCNPEYLPVKVCLDLDVWNRLAGSSEL